MENQDTDMIYKQDLQVSIGRGQTMTISERSKRERRKDEEESSNFHILVTQWAPKFSFNQ